MALIAVQSQRFQEIQADEDDLVLFNEVVATLNDLGHYNRLTRKYQLNLDDHSGCLRDLIRFLRNDGQNFLVRRQMGLSNIVENDLLHIVEQHTIQSDSNGNHRIDEAGKSLMDKIIRLLVDLTNPTILHYPNQKIPKDDVYEMNIYMELQSILFQYKRSFSCRKGFWNVLSKFLTRILELDDENRQVEDELMMERIIILIRNVLHIPIIVNSKDFDDSNVHDRIVEHLHNSALLDIFEYMVSSGEYNQYCFHLLEIIFLIYREQNAEFLAKSVGSDRKLENSQKSNGTLSGQSIHSIGRSQYERERDRKEFEDARNRDHQEYLQMMAKFKDQDYTRFKETAFIVKNMKGVSDRDMICYRAYSNPEKAMDFNKNKVAQRRPRNRRPMNESVGNSDSFGAQQIHHSNRHLRSILYDFCAKFLADSYNKFMAEIRANLSRGAAQEHDETYFLWACQFFMEFNRYQSNITKEQRYRQVYETLSTGMFHYIQTTVDEYMDHLAQKKEFKNELGDWSKRLHQALRSYRELLFSLSSIESMNLAEATKMCFRIKSDIFIEPEYREMLLRLMQTYNEEKMSKAYLRDLIETNHLFLKMLEYHAKICLDFKIKVKKRKIKRRKKKNENKTDDDNEIKKESEENPHEESDQPEIEIEDEIQDMENKGNKKISKAENDNDEPESDEAEDITEIQEKAFSIDDTLMRYAHPNTVRSCRLLLRYYRTNSATTNHSILKMLYRIAVNLKMKPMFYNLGYFLLFEQIMDDPVLRNPVDKQCPHYKSVCELATFAYYIMRCFFKLLMKHPKIASEICFTANSREAYQMEYGFDSEVVTQMIREKKGLSWSEQQILELEVLYKEFKDKATKEKDIVDLIQEHLIDETKTRRQIIIQLKKMDLLQTNDFKKNSHKGPAWSEQELEELKQLYEKFKDGTEMEEIQLEQVNQAELTTMIEESNITDSQREAEFINDNSDTSEVKTNEDQEQNNKKETKKTIRRKRLDIIDCILKHLSTSSIRNRRQIIHQLKISNIYDHSAGKKWNREQIEELRELFCNLFIDFKQSVNLINNTTVDNNESENSEKINIVNKENFVEKLLEQFSDKTKSTRQILRQLRKMDFLENMKTVGIVKGDTTQKSDSKDSAKSKDPDIHSSSDEDNDNEPFDENNSDYEDDDVVIQYEEDDDDEVVVQYDEDDNDLNGQTISIEEPEQIENENGKEESTTKTKYRKKVQILDSSESESEQETAHDVKQNVETGAKKRKFFSDDELYATPRSSVDNVNINQDNADNDSDDDDDFVMSKTKRVRTFIDEDDE